MDNLPIALLNTAIVTTTGIYQLEEISLATAKDLVYHSLTDYADNFCGLDSAIGHEATAEIMSKLLSTDIKMNRQEFNQKVGQIAIVFRLNKRPPEGTILSLDQLIGIGFHFQKLTRIS